MSDLTLYSGRRPKPKPRERRDGPLQSELIPRLVNGIPGCRTHGWLKAAHKAFKDAPEVVGVEDDFYDALNRLNLIPDAYVIHKETLELHFFEVEVSHLLTNAKLEKYAVFLTIMDYYGIEFAVFSVTQHGHINEIHLLPHFVNWLATEHARTKEARA